MEKLIGEVVDLNDDGQGVVKIDSKVFFISGALIGEKVEFEILEDKSKFAFCRLIKVIDKSKKRIDPICKNFLKCGGCDFLNLEYNEELKFKQQKVEKKLKNFNCQIEKILPSKNALNYRNKIKLCFNNHICGMKEEKSHNFFPIENCFLCNEKIESIIKIFNDFLKETNEQNLSEVAIRFLSEKVIIEIFCKNEKIKNVNNIIKKLQNFDENVNIFLIYNNKTQLLFGEQYVYENFLGIKFAVSQGSFLQVNDYIKQKLYEEVLKSINNEIVIDAYSGAGLLSGLISKKCKKCIGIEIFKNAHLDAEKLKEINNINNLTNMLGDCKKVLPMVLKNNSYENITIVLDPPRAGCDKSILLTICNNSNVKKVLYISCNLSTLERDLKILQNNFIVEKIIPFDMFPKTSHIETLVKLVKK